MGNVKKYLIVIGVLVLVFVFFVISRASSIKTVSLARVSSLIKDNTYTMFYSGEVNDSLKEEIKRIKKEYGAQVYVLSNSKEEIISYYGQQGLTDYEGSILFVYDKDSFLGYVDSSKNKDEYIKKYLYDYLPTDERMYKTATGAQYASLFNSNEKIITVFGDDSCSYCNRLENVVNEIVENKLYDIYYMNLSRLSENDVETIYDLNISIPAECTSTGSDRPLIDGYSKPTTIVSKKGKIIGCIKGYYDFNTYISKLSKIMEG